MVSSDEQEFIRGWRARVADEREEAIAWRFARLEEVHLAAARLGAMPGVRRVVLFGSLARGTAGTGSDVDLWVEGLESSRWLDALSVVREVVTHGEVDLVRAESASESLGRRVAAEGCVLYER